MGHMRREKMAGGGERQLMNSQERSAESREGAGKKGKRTKKM